MSTEITTTNQNAIDLFEQAEFTGYENVDDMSVRSFIQLANASSHMEWAEGIKLGQMFNSLTEEVYDELNFIPCYIDKYVTEFNPKDNTYVGRHPIDGEEYNSALDRAKRDEKGRIDYKTVATKSGNSLNATHDLYAMVSADGGDSYFPAVIPMTSTKLTPYTRFFKTLELRPRVTQTGVRKAMLFENICRLTTEQKMNGTNKYYNYKFKHLGHIEEPALAKLVMDYAKASKENVEARKESI